MGSENQEHVHSAQLRNAKSLRRRQVLAGMLMALGGSAASIEASRTRRMLSISSTGPASDAPETRTLYSGNVGRGL